MRTSRRMLKQVRRALFIAFLFSGCINLLMLATPLYILQVFEHVVPLGSIETLVVLTGIAACAIAALALIELARNTILLRAGLWLDHELGQHMLENGLKVGSTPAELNADALALKNYKNYLTGNAVVPVFDAPWVPVFLIILFALHPYIGGVVMVSAAALLLFVLVQALTSNKLQSEGASANDQADRWWKTLASRSGLTGALGLSSGVTGQWEWFNRAQIASSYSLGKRTGFIKVAARAIRIGSQIAVYAVGAWLVVLGEITPGALVASAILAARALGPLDQLVGAVRTIRTAWRAYRRLKDLPDDMVMPRVDVNAHDEGSTLSLSDVSYYYPTRKTPALRAISFDMSEGECMSIVGPNGSGKSTLAAVIAGSVSPTAGSADYDGVPMAKWQRAEGVLPVGYLPDDAFLLEGTVHDNIARFTDSSLISVARSAMHIGAHDTLQALPNGYDTRVGPGGEGLALSERRAVALARAVHGEPKILVLDEPEIGLDGAGIQRLIKCLKQLKNDGTSLVVVTQDPRLVALTDKVALLSDGALHSLSTREELAQRMAGDKVVSATHASSNKSAAKAVQNGAAASDKDEIAGAAV